MKKGNVEYSAFEKVFDESEQAVAQALQELYRLGWITTSKVKKIFFERVSWYGSMGYRFRLAIAYLANQERVVVLVTGGSSNGDERPWEPGRATIYRQDGLCELWRQFKSPGIWFEKGSDDNSRITDWLEKRVGQRRYKRFLKRLQPSSQPYETRIIGNGIMQFRAGSWSGTILRIYAPDKTFNFSTPISANPPYLREDLGELTDPLICALLEIVGVEGVKFDNHSVDVGVTAGVPTERIQKAVITTLNRHG